MVVLDTRLSLAEYVALALGANEDELASREINGGEWMSGAFSFARFMKAHPDLIGLDGWDAASALEPYVNWEDLRDYDYTHVEPRIDFINSWDAIRCPAGYSTLGWAFQLAKKCPHFPEAVKDRSDNKYALFVSLAGHLQAIQGELNIMLPVEELGDYFGIHFSNFTAYRKKAIKDGYLAVVQGHNRMAHKATEFCFDLSKTPEIKKWHGIA